MYPAQYYSPNYNYVPVQQPAPATVIQPTPAPQPTQGSFEWVKGKEEADAYLVAPNASVMLMDMENKCFYVKSADSLGMAQPLRIFDFKERTAAPATSPDYITRKEFDERLAALMKKEASADESAL